LTQSTSDEAMLAIHDSRSGFHPYWVDYCRERGIPHKIVDCYANNIVEQVNDCRALLWHHSHSDPRDILIARQILFALEHAGLTVFPDFLTAWHFDDKVGQKYLLETLDAPLLATYVFVERKAALEWASTTDYPKVFKLRHGASSSCVWFVRNERQARRLIRQAFRRGYTVYNPWDNLKERSYKWRQGKGDVIDFAKGIARFFYPPRFSKVLGRQTGYVLFQDFAPDNDSDIRITVIGDKAYGVRRLNRPGDFRASGSGRDAPGPKNVDIDAVAIAFRLAKKLGSSCLSCDFVYKQDGGLALVEISYGFVWQDDCPGYWDINLNWHDAEYRPEHWMVDLVLSELDRKEVRSGQF
jgi:glutathione synthase/RimK-type ligase-like ATP-grasp enzyme